MPIYEYRCSLCGQELEGLQKVTEPQLTDCPSCGKPGLQKVLTAAGFHLKGSGWYATDFRNSGAKPAAKTDSKDAAKTDSQDAAKTDGKETAKTDSKETAKADGKETAKADSKEAAKAESKTDAPSTGIGASPASS